MECPLKKISNLFDKLIVIFILGLFLLSAASSGIIYSNIEGKSDHEELSSESHKNLHDNSEDKFYNGLFPQYNDESSWIEHDNSNQDDSSSKPKNVDYRYDFSGNTIKLLLDNIPSDFSEGETPDGSKWQFSGFAGAPLLPVRQYRILLPPNAEPKSIILQKTDNNSVVLDGNYLFSPAPYPMIQTPNETIISSSNNFSNIYNQDQFWPSAFIQSFNVQQMRDAIIATFAYYPYQYNPTTKKVIEQRDVQITIKWDIKQNNQVDPLTKKFLTNFGAEIDNLDKMLPYYETTQEGYSASYSNTIPLPSDTPSSTYLIVTTNAIESNSNKLDDFIRYKQALGFTVQVITEDDYGSATGKTRVLNIRSWLQNHYQSDAIEYVLLIGNPNPDDEDDGSDSYGDIPMLMCWPRFGSSSYEQSPTDYFYADLTGDWDSDNDNYYGEYNDDSGVDFAPEVYVGRIPVYSADYTLLDEILDRIINHHINAGTEKNNILEPMAISNYGNEDDSGHSRTDGLDCPEDVYNNILSGIGMTDTVLYERAGLDPVPTSAFHYDTALNYDNFTLEFNNGYGAVFWWGHGSNTGVFRKYWATDDGDGIPESGEMSWSTFLTSSDMNQLENDQPAFFYQSSCNNGEPESSNNLGYALLKRGAAISTVSASRVSWYAVGTWSSSFWSSYSDNTGLGYQYMSYLLKDEMTAGEALFNSKWLGGTGFGDASWMNKMDFNMYGDPQIDYWGSNQPDATNPAPSDGANVVSLTQTLSVDVSDPDGSNLMVSFYDASDNSLIGMDLDVPDGGTASTSWSGLTTATTYTWYVIVSDGQVIKQSANWTFTTQQYDYDVKSSLEVPISPFPKDESVMINATVSNVGSNSASNVELQIIINNTIVANQIYTQILSGGSEILQYSWTPTEYGNYNITAYTVPISGETYIQNNQETDWVVIENDIAVTLETISFNEKNVEMKINATVSNVGLNDVSSVELQLWINETLVDSQTYSNIAFGASETLRYSWIPIKEGNYNITAYALPVTAETDFSNNFEIDWITVPELCNYIMDDTHSYNWIDATSGTLLSLFDDDSEAVSLPFSFQFYDQTFDTVYVSSNGWLSFDNINPNEYSNVPYPSTDPDYYYSLALFWDDLTPSSNVYVLVESNKVVIEYQNIDYYGGGTAGSFEVILYETGEIIFQYDYIDSVYSYTIGLNYGLNSYYYNSYTEVSGTTDNLAILFAQETGEHDLSTSLNVSQYLLKGESMLVNASVKNVGDNNEIDVELQILINDTIVESQVFSGILVNETKILQYHWIPANTKAFYNVTAYAIPVSDEVILSNNQVASSVTVTESLTIMFYLDGDVNLESLAIDDFNELESGIANTGFVNILVLMDRHPEYDESNGNWTSTRLYEVVANTTDTIESNLLIDYGELNMGDPTTLTNFLNYCFENYTADHYLLNLWDHGSGIQGVCWDDSNGNDYLTIEELQSAITSSETTYSEKIDIISFIACLMNMLEVAYELRDLADYLVASEEVMYGQVVDWEDVLTRYGNNQLMSMAQLSTELVESYAEDWTPVDIPTTYSAIDLSVVSSIIPYVNDLTTILTDLANNGYTFELGQVRAATQDFYDPMFMDFIHYLENLLAKDSLLTAEPTLEATIDALLTQLNSAVIANYQHLFDNNANGLSIYMPYDYVKYDTDIADYLRATNNYENLDWLADGNWEAFLEILYTIGYLTMTEQWSFETMDYVDASPAFLDVEKDGAPEILIGSYDGYFYCIDQNGSEVWSYNINDPISSSPTIADLNNDAIIEIIFGTNNGSVVCLNETGDWQWTYSTGVGIFLNTAGVADLNNDGKLEVVITSNDGKVYCLDYRGNSVWIFNGDASYESSPAFEDLNDDGNLEILVGTTSGNFTCLNHTGDLEWHYMAGGSITSSAIVADLQIDGPSGTKEILFGSHDGYLYCLNSTGDLQWREFLDVIDYSSPIVADVNNDFIFDIIVNAGSSVFCLNETGHILWSYETKNIIYSSPVVVDLMGNGQLEILVSSMDETLYCLTANGRFIGNFTTQGPILSTPLIKDLDADGIVEIIFGSWDYKVYCLELPGLSSTGNAPYYCFRATVFRTGAPDTDGDFIDYITEVFYYSTSIMSIDTDSDNLDEYSEIHLFGTNPTNPDSDGDEMTDGYEVENGLDPNFNDNMADPDNDALENLYEYRNGTRADDPDTDNDGLEDGEEVNIHETNPLATDSDNDGIEDYEEVNNYPTDPNDPDSDNDEMTDGYEVENGLDPMSDDGMEDPDNDNLENLYEYRNGTRADDPDTDNDGLEDGEEINNFETNPLVADTDNDGLGDYEEIHDYNTDPNDQDTDDDGLTDYEEINDFSTDPNDEDSDNDRLLDGEEENEGTDPLDKDSDGDGLEDGEEVNNHNTDPNNPDTDGDGLTDSQEINNYATDPTDYDTDNDSLSDGEEISDFGTDPNDADSDDDNLDDNEELDLGTNPNRADTDGDRLDDNEELSEGTDPLDSDSDDDGLTDGYEINNFNTNPNDPDSDNDGLTDGQEQSHSTNPNDSDTDNDSLGDYEEVNIFGTNPTNADSDSDGLEDAEEIEDYGTDATDPDSDDDGLNDYSEIINHSTNPLDFDSDDDTMSDGYEVTHGLDPLDPSDADNDKDEDSVTNAEEFSHGTDPTDPDSDNDGLLDGEELNQYSTDPLDQDSDDDGLGDGNEIDLYNTDPNNPDSDDDNLTDQEEVNNFETDPNDPDSDDDGLNDGDEINHYRTDPNIADTDGDNLSDGAEVNDHGSDPTDKDSDNDGLEDGEEVNNFNTDPTSTDSDGDNLTDYEELNEFNTNPNKSDSDEDGLTDSDEINNLSTNPLDPDSDDDGLNDGDEINHYNTDPNNLDTDGDQLSDGAEVNEFGTNPTAKDSDGDGFSDWEEINQGFDPLEANNHPRSFPIWAIIVIIVVAVSIFAAGGIITYFVLRKKKTEQYY
ncbi:MAG: PQQ-binding-like beta-propeller repeat protein [Candidatus Heimdallarchaeota archaeon]|nr:PQQ-binding-like beta-propeller repeat protein [Candidatus Heimdallarchaeota archaeon]